MENLEKIKIEVDQLHNYLAKRYGSRIAMRLLTYFEVQVSMDYFEYIKFIMFLGEINHIDILIIFFIIFDHDNNGYLCQSDLYSTVVFSIKMEL